MAAIATLDLSSISADGRTRKVQMQTDSAETIRLVQLPWDAHYQLTIGPVTDSSGALLSARVSYAMGATGTYANNAAGTSLADAAVRGDLAAGDSRTIASPRDRRSRMAELALWSDSTSAYVEITLDSLD